MRNLIDLLLQQPLLLFVLATWVIGWIANIVRARNQAEARRRQRTSGGKAPEVPVGKPVDGDRQTMALPGGAHSQRNEREEVPGARRTPAPSASSGSGARTAAADGSAEQLAREMRRILGIEPRESPAVEPPAAAVPPPPPTARARSASRVDPHVGEGIRDRHLAQSRVGRPAAGRGELGGLGGRTRRAKKQSKANSRYALEELRQAIVVNEILSPPLALRPFDERRPV